MGKGSKPAELEAAWRNTRTKLQENAKIKGKHKSFKIYRDRGNHTTVNSMLFAPVPCNASINKSSASHFCPVRVRILWLLTAVNCLSLPFTYRTLCGRASPFPPSLNCPFHFQLTQTRFHLSVSYSARVKGTVANSMLYACFNKIHENSSISIPEKLHHCQRSKK